MSTVARPAWVSFTTSWCNLPSCLLSHSSMLVPPRCSCRPVHHPVNSGAGQAPSEQGTGHHTRPGLLRLHCEQRHCVCYTQPPTPAWAAHQKARKTCIMTALPSPALLAAAVSPVQVPAPAQLQQLGHESLQFTLVDCPGHASLIRTIIGGAQIIDTMILVIDVTKGDCFDQAPPPNRLVPLRPLHTCPRMPVLLRLGVSISLATTADVHIVRHLSGSGPVRCTLPPNATQRCCASVCAFVCAGIQAQTAECLVVGEIAAKDMVVALNKVGCQKISGVRLRALGSSTHTHTHPKTQKQRRQHSADQQLRLAASRKQGPPNTTSNSFACACW